MSEVIQADERATSPFKYEISQNSKGYVQLKVTVRTDKPIDTDADKEAIRMQFAEAFDLMRAEAIEQGLKIQPDNDPIDQKHYNVVINDLEQHEAEDIVQHLRDWADQEDTPTINDCMDIIPPKVKPRK